MRSEIVFWKGYTEDHEKMLGVQSRKFVDEDKIQSCINYSFERKGDYESDNLILKDDKEAETV